MTYRAGTRGLGRIGIPDDEPRITCDGCGMVLYVRGRGVGDIPPLWFLDNKAPKGWRLSRVDRGDIGIERRDWCPRCKDGAEPGKAES